MSTMFKNIFEPFLTNEIVINWIAPIITGLVVVGIPAIILKVLQIKKDEKKVNAANQRYVDSIRPYIIQKIEITPELITDLRKVVVRESNLKDKYVYSELELRNKLIMDITENKYIDEVSKHELITFTYKSFKAFEKQNIVVEESKTKILKKLNIDYTIIVFIISIVIMIIVSIVDKEGTKTFENPAALLSTITCLFSMLALFINLTTKFFRSGVIEKREYNYYTNYFKVLNDLIKLKEMQIKKNKDNKK